MSNIGEREGKTQLESVKLDILIHILWIVFINPTLKVM